MHSPKRPAAKFPSPMIGILISSSSRAPCAKTSNIISDASRKDRVFASTGVPARRICLNLLRHCSTCIRNDSEQVETVVHLVPKNAGSSISNSGPCYRAGIGLSFGFWKSGESRLRLTAVSRTTMSFTRCKLASILRNTPIVRGFA